MSHQAVATTNCTPLKEATIHQWAIGHKYQPTTVNSFTLSSHRYPSCVCWPYPSYGNLGEETLARNQSEGGCFQLVPSEVIDNVGRFASLDCSGSPAQIRVRYPCSTSNGLSHLCPPSLRSTRAGQASCTWKAYPTRPQRWCPGGGHQRKVLCTATSVFTV